MANIFEGGNADNGKTLFKNNCASCHSIDGSIVAAPSLKGIDARWKEGDAMLVKWIQNPTGAIASGNAYIASLMAQYKGSFGVMTAQAVSEAEIKDIMAYVKAGEVAAAPGSAVVDNKCVPFTEEELNGESKSSGDTFIWFVIIGLILGIIAVSSANISKSLKNAIKENSGQELEEELSYGVIARRWMWKHKVFVSLIGLFVFCYIVVVGYKSAMDIGVYEKYQPEQPIAFSHAIHACQNEIDCQYCHSSASKSKHAGIPSVDVCMNCHKAIQKGAISGTTEIEKIYAAIGFDPATGTYIENYEQKPIEWVKVHNLPDHVYFPHESHVAIAGIDCRQCHGPVQRYTVGRIASIDEINAQDLADVPGLIKLTKQTLTMGWCIECHGAAKIDITSDKANEYYQEMHERYKQSDLGLDKLREILEDGSITVKEMGGWECGKCHY
ncbi:MAG: c-type cytochrome [Flavobacteriales bacterium]|nr:c-type cytochrome [Flavobacteriales bacterium]